MSRQPERPSGMDRRALLAGGVGALLAAPSLARSPGSPARGALAAQVSQARLRADVTALAELGTRWTPGAGFPAVEDWMTRAFAQAGALDKDIHRLPYDLRPDLRRHNILCGNPRAARGIVLVGAHVDSTSEDPDRLAPGANDNATGVAAMLEIRRILGPLDLPHALVCVAFTGEEQEQAGSSALARQATREGWRIRLMINLDMLGHRPDNPQTPMVIEYDQGNRRPDNDAGARRWGLRAVELAAEHTTGIAVETGDIWGSDYMAFEAEGHPCIGLYDNGVGAAQYHSTTDVPESVAFDRLEQATRLALVLTAEAAGLAA